MIIPAVITVYADRSFSFVTKTPPASKLLLKNLKLGKGSSNPKRERVAKITREQLREIAEIKMPDLNAYDIDAAIKIVAGTAKSCGITVVD
jgi:large subunit ribosomal protein L11